MTSKNEIDKLKTLAKRYARANRIAQHEALNAMAAALDFPHWAYLAAKAKQGWLPTAEQLAMAEALVHQTHPGTDEKESFIGMSLSRPVDEPIRQGKIGDHDYRVFEAFGDIRMEGDGWRILVGEAQFSQPLVEIEKPHADTSPVSKQDFLEAALVIADEEAAKVRAGIASDWPRRSTKPDTEGVVLHPLFGGKSAEWFCLHCDGKITGTQLAENLWYCPGCGASPIDIFSEPAWLEDSDVTVKPVKGRIARQRPEPMIEVVDSRPTLTLGEDSSSLLLRTALLEDATTPAERIGAQLAEISVDDDGDACIVLDEDLWPESKEPETAMAVAELLGAELDISVTCMTFPFAWPGLGHATTSTREYVRMLLEAHEEQGVVHRKSEDD
ncbi:hypothetical protein N0B44_33510 [Roseibacterium beibuensis]|uniref:Uncharacterized protein n=1 Tax=[Roseibacterium] beibuensis TaxID=1193142 RepID=A0ABP9LU16_9RHOB|nr:hypothetical protein [Roseibacterium beibuensis]MCS6627830.1 hypothetical protein [Roseibacterium beibuensis]